MGTQSTAAEGRFELGEKYRRWKETYLPAGDTPFTYPLGKQLEALGDERLIAAHEAAMAGAAAEKLLDHINPVCYFNRVVELTTGLLFKRGLHHKRSWCE